jgi:hypothetical protein
MNFKKSEIYIILDYLRIFPKMDFMFFKWENVEEEWLALQKKIGGGQS